MRMLTGTDRASARTPGSRLSFGTVVLTQDGITAPPPSGVRLVSPKAATLIPPAHSTAAAMAVTRAQRPADLRGL
jgi:hypothetical protein